MAWKMSPAVTAIRKPQSTRHHPDRQPVYRIRSYRRRAATNTRWTSRWSLTSAEMLQEKRTDCFRPARGFLQVRREMFGDKASTEVESRTTSFQINLSLVPPPSRALLDRFV